MINHGNEIATIIAQFVAAVTNAKYYLLHHPQALSAVDRLYGSVQKFFEQMPELTLFLMDDEIIAFDRPLPHTGQAGDALVKILRGKGIERITFLKGLALSELHDFIGCLAAVNRQSITASSHIRLGKVLLNSLLEDGGLGTAENQVDYLSFNQKAAAELRKMYLEIQGNKVPDTGKVKEIVAEFIKIHNHSINPLKILAQFKSEDEYTYIHIANVALLTICLADYLGFSGKNLQDIGVAALLHDVGKMFIPDQIYKKPGPLTADERALVETHTLKGAQYIGYQHNIPKLTMIAALEHHIRYDGSGYPLIAGRWRPNIASQMISIADVYDALRNKRPYHEALPYGETRAILITGRGSTFNPALVDHFLTMIER